MESGSGQHSARYKEGHPYTLLMIDMRTHSAASLSPASASSAIQETNCSRTSSTGDWKLASGNARGTIVCAILRANNTCIVGTKVDWPESEAVCHLQHYQDGCWGTGRGENARVGCEDSNKGIQIGGPQGFSQSIIVYLNLVRRRTMEAMSGNCAP